MSVRLSRKRTVGILWFSSQGKEKSDWGEAYLLMMVLMILSTLTESRRPVLLR